MIDVYYYLSVPLHYARRRNGDVNTQLKRITRLTSSGPRATHGMNGHRPTPPSPDSDWLSYYTDGIYTRTLLTIHARSNNHLFVTT